MSRQLRLTDRGAARRTLARLIREFDRDPEADAGRFKALVHAMNVLLSYDRADAELALDERLAEIERRLSQYDGRSA